MFTYNNKFNNIFSTYEIQNASLVELTTILDIVFETLGENVSFTN